jgi:uncharacterized UPF0146 family protein
MPHLEEYDLEVDIEDLSNLTYGVEINNVDDDMTPTNMTIYYNVSLYLYLHNNKSKNWLLHNIDV